MDRLKLFPDSIEIVKENLRINGFALSTLAEEFGTPLYIYDQASLDGAASLYRHALEEYYPAESGVTYAGKAFLCLAMAQWTQQQGLWLDCTGQGEISIAVAGGVRREHLLVHGVNKSPLDLNAARRYAGTVVVDHLEELQTLLSLPAEGPEPDLWLRFQPGVEVETHTHVQTGQLGSKFGMEREELKQATGLLRQSGRSLKGLHFHLGSQIRQAAPVGEAIQRTLEAALSLGMAGAWTLSPGGGWGVAYNENELPQPNARAYIRLVAGAVNEGCRRLGLPLPRLQLEPGRSLAARAGVALYRVGAVKRSGGRTWVLLDGGLADNPRHALYGVNYSALLVDRPAAPTEERVYLAGPYCESGDVLSMDLPMPLIKAGELIAVPVSGAYQLSMSSNYNGACRPAVVWVREDKAQLIQERESPADLLRRDKPLAEANGQ